METSFHNEHEGLSSDLFSYTRISKVVTLYNNFIKHTFHYCSLELFISLSHTKRQSAKHKRHSIKHSGNIKILLQKQWLFIMWDYQGLTKKQTKKNPHPLKFKTISEFYQCIHYKIWNKDENMNEGRRKWKKQRKWYKQHVLNLRWLWVIQVKISNRQINI